MNGEGSEEPDDAAIGPGAADERRGVASSPFREEFAIGILLSIRGQRPVEHWLHHTACFAAAFEALTDLPWSDEFADQYVPTVGGVPMEWRGRVDSALVHTWGNHVTFVPVGPGSGAEGRQQEQATSMEPEPEEGAE